MASPNTSSVTLCSVHRCHLITKADSNQDSCAALIKQAELITSRVNSALGPEPQHLSVGVTFNLADVTVFPRKEGEQLIKIFASHVV